MLMCLGLRDGKETVEMELTVHLGLSDNEGDSDFGDWDFKSVCPGYKA